MVHCLFLKMASNLKLKTLGLPTVLADKLANQNINTVQDFLELSLMELQRKTGLTYQKVSFITAIVNGFIAPPAVLVSQIIQSSYVMFNDRLDIFLGGGVKCGQITEFSGAPGLGKTQLCFQLAAANALHGKVNSNGVLYIDSEGAFSALRLLEIAMQKFDGKIHSDSQVENLLGNIHVWRPENLQEILDKMIQIEIIIIKRRIGLVIIDSMGSIVRRQYGGEKSIERGAIMCSLSSSFKRIAHTFNIAVVVTNHVTAKMNMESENSSNNASIPALGASWSHWINSRLHLSVCNNTRRIHIAKSAELPELSCGYRVTDKGVELDDTDF